MRKKVTKRKKRRKPKKTLGSWKKTKQTLFGVQPSRCRKRLSKIRKIENIPLPLQRLFEYNPIELYKRINEADILSPYMRACPVSMVFLFPKKKGVCSCGCGVKLVGRQRKWASKDCTTFAGYVFDIISGKVSTIKHLLFWYYGGYICKVCGQHNHPENPIELDHIHPVYKGGGGGWLSNYDFKCRACHRVKTNKDLNKDK